MLKSVLTTLCRLHRHHPLYQQWIDTGVVCRVQQLHVTGCCRVLDKDHPSKKVADSSAHRSHQDQVMSDSPELDLAMQDLKIDSFFPTMETRSMLIGGVRYDELPIIHIKSTHNNTIITVTNGKGEALASESGGTVGFRNVRKGTNIAAQAAAIAIAEKATKKGIDLVRISVKGIGPGRLPAIKGLQMSGITIVSITDATPVPHNGLRPKKQRRL